jgi:UDP:flavonoid glycosyltransferase YjiC (YdhE family)
MSRILMAWELGGNYGHISILLPLARHLRQNGHEILFAVRDIKRVSQLVEKHGFALVQAPLVKSFGSLKREPLSFADILDEAGFGDVEALTALVSGWQNLFKLYPADTVVCEYAPIAQFAANLSGMSCLHLNTGFGLPPDTAPYPCFRPWRKPTKEQLLQREKELLENINSILLQRGFPEFESIQKAIKSDVDLFVALPELDHYQRRNTRHFIGPILMTDDGVELQWADQDVPRIFVYLKPGPEIRLILESLRKSNASVIAIVPGIDGTLKEAFLNDWFQISSVLINLSGILKDMDLAITHSGHGTASAMILAGVPMLLLPTTIEQWMLSRTLTKHGVGIEVRRDRFGEEFNLALDKLLSDSSYRANAKSLAKKYANFDSSHVLEKLTNTIEHLPEWKKKRAGNRTG